MAAGAAGPGDESEDGAPGACRLPTQPTQPTNRANPALQPTFVMILPRCRSSRQQDKPVIIHAYRAEVAEDVPQLRCRVLAP